MKVTESVLIIGSGITALVSALKAVRQGMVVTIVSKSPCTLTSAPDQLFQSSTHDGSYNRYITSTEGHPYLELDGYVTGMYPGIGEDFEKTIAEGGMLALPMDKFGADTQRFLQERKALNQQIKADKETRLRYEQLFEEYVLENVYSMKLWYEELTKFLIENPDLTHELSLSVGIHRFYDEKKLFESAREALTSQGIIKAAFTIEEALANEDFTSYQEGMKKQSFIKGGALIMHGLAFNIKEVTKLLVTKLQKANVQFFLGREKEIVEVKYNASRHVEGVITRDGCFYTADHVLVHGGAYLKPHLFESNERPVHVCGMKGFWAHIKGKTAERIIQGMGSSPKACKIHGGRTQIVVNGKEYLSQVADLNVEPVILEKENGEKEYILCIGSGYLFVGTYPFEGDCDIPKENVLSREQIDAVRQSEQLAIAGFWEVVRRVYNLDLDLNDCLAQKHPDVEILKKGCIRSWSMDDKELRLIQKTSKGGVVIIHGGGNTGSTTKSMFESTVAMAFIAQNQETSSLAALEASYESIRKSLREQSHAITSETWLHLEEQLEAAYYQLI